MEIIEGKVQSALKVCLYGVEGIGKSTLASQFPRPLFIDAESGTKFMNVRRTKCPLSWTEFLTQIGDVWANPSVCDTLVIDTADQVEQLCISEFCAKKKLVGIEELSYGKGYVYIAEDFGRLLNTLSEITEKGVHVVLIAHAKIRKFEQPDEMGAYDRWELKLQKTIAPLVKSWADLLLFANYKTISVAADKDGKKFKAQGGRRVLYTTHHPCWDAKNRLGLPEEMAMDWEALAPYLPGRSGGTTGESIPPKAAAPAESSGDAGGRAEADDTGGTSTGNAGLPAGGRIASAAPPPRNDRGTGPTGGPSSASAQETGDAGPVPAVLAPLLESAGVTEAEVREVIAKRQGSFPLGTTWQVMEGCGFVQGWVLPYWKNIVQMIKDSRNSGLIPF